MAPIAPVAWAATVAATAPGGGANRRGAGPGLDRGRINEFGQILGNVVASARAFDGDEAVAVGGAAARGNCAGDVVAVDLAVRERLRELACAAVGVRRRLTARFAVGEAAI